MPARRTEKSFVVPVEKIFGFSISALKTNSATILDIDPHVHRILAQVPGTRTSGTIRIVISVLPNPDVPKQTLVLCLSDMVETRFSGNRHPQFIADFFETLDVLIETRWAPLALQPYHETSPQRLSDELRDLIAMRNEGILTEDDLAQAMRHLLGAKPNQAEEKIQLIKHLYDLHVAGGLSESEYNIKKWELLA